MFGDLLLFSLLVCCGGVGGWRREKSASRVWERWGWGEGGGRRG